VIIFRTIQIPFTKMCIQGEKLKGTKNVKTNLDVQTDS